MNERNHGKYPISQAFSSVKAYQHAALLMGLSVNTGNALDFPEIRHAKPYLRTSRYDAMYRFFSKALDTLPKALDEGLLRIAAGD